MAKATIRTFDGALSGERVIPHSKVVPLASNLSRPGVICFPKHMGTPAQQPAPPPQEPAPKFSPQRWGTVAQIGSFVAAFLSVCLVLYFHFADSASKASDEHIKLLSGEQVNGAEAKIDHRFDLLGQRLDRLDDRVNRLSDDVHTLIGQINKTNVRVSAQEEKQKQLLAVNAIVNPNRVLGVIRKEIELARTTGKAIPGESVVDYKEALKTLPQSSAQYWITVAEVINYQSLLNQLVGYAPDPRSISRPCMGLTDNGRSGDNVIIGGAISNCILDLDTTHNLIQGVTIMNSVIRYHGGPVTFQAVTFVNCYFELDIPATPPARPNLLLALLDSDQRKVTLSTRG